MNDEVLELIVQKPIQMHYSEAVCPYCNSNDYEDLGTMKTMMGSGNHHWNRRKCNSCSKFYTVEYKSGNLWITGDEGKVFSGVANCFESYTYDCKCGGKVERLYTDIDGVTPAKSLGAHSENGKWIKTYRIFWKCNKCNTTIETESDCFHK